MRRSIPALRNMTRAVHADRGCSANRCASRFRAGRIVETDGSALDKLASMPPGCVIAITDKELDRTLHAEAVRRLAPALAGSFRIIEPTAASFAQRPADETGGRK